MVGVIELFTAYLTAQIIVLLDHGHDSGGQRGLSYGLRNVYCKLWETLAIGNGEEGGGGGGGGNKWRLDSVGGG